MKIKDLSVKYNMVPAIISHIRKSLDLPKGKKLSTQDMIALEKGIIEYQNDKKAHLFSEALCEKYNISSNTLTNIRRKLKFKSGIKLTPETQSVLENAILKYKEEKTFAYTMSVGEFGRLIGIPRNTIINRYKDNPLPSRLTKEIQAQIIQDFKDRPRKPRTINPKQKYIDIYAQMIEEDGLTREYIKKVTNQTSDNILTTLEGMGLLCYIEEDVVKKSSFSGKGRTSLIKAFNPIRDAMRAIPEGKYCNGYQSVY